MVLSPFQLRELLSREVHGPAPHQARQQGLHAPPEAAHHGPHQADHLRGRPAGRLLQGGPPPHAGKDEWEFQITVES